MSQQTNNPPQNQNGNRSSELLRDDLRTLGEDLTEVKFFLLDLLKQRNPQAYLKMLAKIKQEDAQ